MATLQERVSLLATRIGNECKVLHGRIGSLTELPEAQRASLVAAIKNINASLATITGDVAANAGSITTLQGSLESLQGELDALEEQVAAATNIDDSKVGTTTTYSSSKVMSEIAAAKQEVKNDLLDGAGEAYDTLKELGAAIEANKGLIEAFEAVAAGHIKFDGAQSLTDDQKAQARTNIGAASAADLTALDTRVGTAEGKISTAEGKISTLEGKMSTAEGKVSTLEGKMTTAEGKIADNESALAGHGERLTAVEAKANAAATAVDLNALTGRVTTVEGKAGANETAIANLAAAVGATDTDYVAVFEAAMAA